MASKVERLFTLTGLAITMFVGKAGAQNVEKEFVNSTAMGDGINGVALHTGYTNAKDKSFKKASTIATIDNRLLLSNGKDTADVTDYMKNLQENLKAYNADMGQLQMGDANPKTGEVGVRVFYNMDQLSKKGAPVTGRVTKTSVIDTSGKETFKDQVIDIDDDQLMTRKIFLRHDTATGNVQVVVLYGNDYALQLKGEHAPKNAKELEDYSKTLQKDLPGETQKLEKRLKGGEGEVVWKRNDPAFASGASFASYDR